jgi:signal transduction histidine kinase
MDQGATLNEGATLIIVLVAVAILLLLLIVVAILFSVFMRRKNSLVQEQQKIKKHYEQEISETQIEIREETLRNISWELHDNIGQLLTLAKIQTQNAAGSQKDLDEAAATIGKGLSEIRTLSKLINPEALKNMTLVEALSLELERFNRMAYLKPAMHVKGRPFIIDKKIETVIFRMLQEFFTNTIRHSKATKLDVTLSYVDNQLTIIVVDNGIGFDYAFAKAKNGIGLSNIETRAQLIGATATYHSAPGKGTQLKLTYTPQPS